MSRTVVAIGLAASTLMGAEKGHAMSLFQRDTSQEDVLGAWREAAPVGPGRSRLTMLDTALAAVPAGTAKDAVAAALGTPYTDYGDRWLYVVDVDTFGREYQYLQVTFDAAGAVTSAETVTENQLQAPTE